MDYSKDYLLSLIENKVEESLNLDYKSAMALDKQPSKTAEISKDISSFANSDGGIIVYGIKEDNEQRHFPKELDPVKRKDFSKEWLEQIINDKIKPRIDNLKIHPIPITDEEVIYIVEIGKSDTAHQADDKKYYKRFNFQSVPMYDYEIRDILNRQKHPKLELSFDFDNRITALIVYVNNVGSVFANYVNVKIRLPKKIVVERRHNGIIKNNIVEIFATNTVREMVDPYSQVAKYWPSRYEPILPKTRFELIKILLHSSPFDYENIIEWEIFCDNANPVAGSFRLADLLNR